MTSNHGEDEGENGDGEAGLTVGAVFAVGAIFTSNAQTAFRLR